MLCLSLALELVTRHEGFEPTIYNCPAGYPSIGYGRNLNFYPLTQEEKLAYTDDNGDVIISKTVAKMWAGQAIRAIYAQVKDKSYFVNQTPERQAAMLDMIYNMGMTSFNKFKNFQKAMSEKNFELAAVELQTGTGAGGKSKWYLQTKTRAENIIHIIQTSNLDLPY